MSNLIYIMGKSASGKDTIYKELKERMDLNTYVLYTTRPMREGEQEGREYNFITRDHYKELEEEGKVIEARHYNVVNAQGEKDVWTYATIDDKQWEKNGDFLTIGTLESYNSIKKYLENHPDKKLKLLPVYIFVDEFTRRSRAVNREKQSGNPNYKEMERRLKADNVDFSQEKLEEAGIIAENIFINDNIDTCCQEIVKYVDYKTNKFKKLVMMPREYNQKEREAIKKKEKELFERKNENDEGR